MRGGLSEDMIFACKNSPVEVQLVGRGAQTGAGGLQDRDLDRGVRGAGVGAGHLGELEGDGGEADGFSNEPAYALLYILSAVYSSFSCSFGLWLKRCIL